MSFHSRKLFIITAAVLLIVLSGCSLAEDITPPPNYRPPTPAPQQPVVNETVFPLVPPDVEQGASIYAEKCLPCHGATGMGDGPQAGNLPNPAAPIGSPELARASRPVDWYNMVTIGNLEKFMPGFSNSLNDRQRWDVVAYAMSLSVNSTEITQGKALYDQSCAECHGETGLGDGAQAASLPVQPISWVKDQSRLSTLSAEEMAQVMSGGKEGHPSFSDTLDESERYMVAAYVRSLSFASIGQDQIDPSLQLATEEPSAANAADSTAVPESTAVVTSAITVRGKVSNATPGGSVPQGLKAILLAFSGMDPAFDLTVDVADDGSYVFNDVEYNSDYVYMVRVDANGLAFNSDILHGTDVTAAEADLPVSIYDTSSDASGLRSDRMHLFFDFSTPGQVQVANLYILSNPTDTIIVAPTEGEPVVRYELPEGATNLLFEDGALGDRYVQTENGFGDRMSIAPGIGMSQILFAYDLPYDRKMSLKLKVPMPVDAVVVMMPPGFKLSSGQLIDAGQRDVQGMSVQMYQASGSLEAGETLDLTLSGDANSGGGVGQDSITYLLIGLAGFGFVLIGAGWWMYTGRKKQEPALVEGPEDEIAVEETASSDSILDEILALDDLHASGKIPEAAYQERRTALKARLAEAMKQEKGG